MTSAGHVAGSLVLWTCVDGHDNDPGNAQCVWCGKSRPIVSVGIQPPPVGCVPGQLYPETKAAVNDVKMLGARWECGSCTVVNEATLGCCVMCASPRRHNDAHLEAVVPMSQFSLAIKDRIEVEAAKGHDMDFALMGQLKSVDLPASRALDIAAHMTHLACAARKAELDAPLAAAMEANDYERCNALQPGVKKAAAQLTAATGARAKDWAKQLVGTRSKSLW